MIAGIVAWWVWYSAGAFWWHIGMNCVAFVIVAAISKKSEEDGEVLWHCCLIWVLWPALILYIFPFAFVSAIRELSWWLQAKWKLRATIEKKLEKMDKL